MNVINVNLGYELLRLSYVLFIRLSAYYAITWASSIYLISSLSIKLSFFFGIKFSENKFYCANRTYFVSYCTLRFFNACSLFVWIKSKYSNTLNSKSLLNSISALRSFTTTP